MCDPLTAIAAGSLILSAGSSIAQHNAAQKASRQNRQEALRAMVETFKDIGLRQQQEQDATSLTILQADRQARAADAIARVSAGESGVAGASVEALATDISRDASQFKVVQQQNLDMTIAQLQREKAGVQSGARNRIASVPPPNPWMTGLSIAGAGLDFASNYIRQRPS